MTRQEWHDHILLDHIIAVKDYVNDIIWDSDLKTNLSGTELDNLYSYLTTLENGIENRLDKEMLDYTKRFIVFTDKDLEDIKAGKVVVTENCDFSNYDKPYDIYCVSEKWMKEYDNLNMED